MAIATKKRKTAETRAAESVFRNAFPDAQVEAYRYNTASIRVRVIDQAFEGKDRIEREALAWPALEKLDAVTKAATRDDVTVLLLLTPAEHADGSSILDHEFDDPSPSTF